MLAARTLTPSRFVLGTLTCVGGLALSAAVGMALATAIVKSAEAATLQEPAGDTRNAALIGLVGLRCGLFPEAPAYQPHKPDHRRLAA